jgi:hypothetical protein
LFADPPPGLDSDSESEDDGEDIEPGKEWKQFQFDRPFVMKAEDRAGELLLETAKQEIKALLSLLARKVRVLHGRADKILNEEEEVQVLKSAQLMDIAKIFLPQSLVQFLMDTANDGAVKIGARGFTFDETVLLLSMYLEHMYFGTSIEEVFKSSKFKGTKDVVNPERYKRFLECMGKGATCKMPGAAMDRGPAQSRLKELESIVGSVNRWIWEVCLLFIIDW